MVCCEKFRLKHKEIFMTNPRIYLAGPDVFLPNASEIFDEMEEKCRTVGFVGMRPADGGLSQGIKGTPDEIAERIYLGNMEILRSCQGILANMQPFRTSVEPDSGTVFEVGVGIALGKTVYGYLPDHNLTLEDKIRKNYEVVTDENGISWDKKHGFMVEEFSQPMNLMLARSMMLFENFDDALLGMRKALLPSRICKP